jgi:hypothetical protein
MNPAPVVQEARKRRITRVIIGRQVHSVLKAEMKITPKGNEQAPQGLIVAVGAVSLPSQKKKLKNLPVRAVSILTVVNLHPETAKEGQGSINK